MKKWVVLLCAVVLPALFWGMCIAEETPSFNLSEIEQEVEKKPYAFGGFLQAQPTLSGLDQDSPLYKLKCYADEPGGTLEQ